MSQPRISIIILNYNGLDDTIRCLESLKKITYPNYEVIVVDNGSEGNDADILEKNYKDYIKLIRFEKNLGFSKGNNIAIKENLNKKKSKYVLLLNNDTKVSPNFLTELVKIVKGDPAVGMVTPKILNPNGSIQRSNRKFPTPFLILLSFCLPRIFLTNRIKDFIAKNNFIKKFLGETISSYFWSFESGEPTEIENASGACLLAKREMIKQIGMLDEKMVHGANDVDWCYRAKKRGWKIIYVPKAKIIHYVGRSFKDKLDQYRHFCYQIKTYHWYVKKYYNKIDILKVKLILLLALATRTPQIMYCSIFKKQDQNSNLWGAYWLTLITIITK